MYVLRKWLLGTKKKNLFREGEVFVTGKSSRDIEMLFRVQESVEAISTCGGFFFFE